MTTTSLPTTASAAEETTITTNSPTTVESSNLGTSEPTSTPTTATSTQNSIESTALSSTPSPTPLSPYPLQGPFTEQSMRIVLYGITELNHMGSTQFTMLTAAYVEQFFNHEGVGDDAIQNIVFDVVCSVEIEYQVILGSSRSRRRGRSVRRALITDNVQRLDETRALQGEGLIVTFSMTLSYRTFSSHITADTVAERPFFDEDIREGYLQFLIDNNALSHMGDVSGISPIFRGDNVPEEVDVPSLEDEEVIVATLPPQIEEIIPEPPTETVEEMQEPFTDRPTPQPSPLFIEEAITPSPSEQATPQQVVPEPLAEQTPKPTISMPGETYYPTPTNQTTYYPTPSALSTDDPTASLPQDDTAVNDNAASSPPPS